MYLTVMQAAGEPLFYFNMSREAQALHYKQPHDSHLYLKVAMLYFTVESRRANAVHT